MNENSKHLLTRAEDRISFLYIEKAKITQTDYSVEIISGAQRMEIPITYDIADLYKEQITIPLAFELASKGQYNRKKALLTLRNVIVQQNLMRRIVRDIHAIIGDADTAPSMEAELYLWDKKLVNARKNYSKT